MLIRPKDIFEVEPPFLIVFGNGAWKIAKEIVPHPGGIAFFEPFSDQTNNQADGILKGTPWHVGNNVWEMDYRTQIMTLNHPLYHRHPAWRLWLQWLATKDDSEPRATH